MTPLVERFLGSAASAVDHAFVTAFQLRNRGVRRGPESLSHEQRMAALAEIRAEYGRPELIADTRAFFVPPPSVRAHQRRVRKLSWSGECIDLSWDSAFEPFHATLRDAYLAHVPNRRAHARLYVSERQGRPAAIVVHGYMAGHFALEERIWPIRRMNELGLDVALLVLPFHGLRGPADGSAPPFPGADPRFTNEGFRQAVADLRVLSALLRERGAPLVGIMGMSLGGYSSALLATLESDLAFAVPIIPLASIADFARYHGRLGTGQAAAAQHAALEAANRVVSPLARPALVPPQRVLVVAAQDDRVAPLADHAERLAHHFAAPLLRLHGGHLLQTWRTAAFREIERMLRTAGIVRP